jgi:hypothetical protein
MKNYLDLLDTDDPGVTVELIINSIVDNGIPHLKVSVNNQTFYNSKIDQKICIRTTIPLLSRLSVQLDLENRLYSDKRETAVIIESFKIDDYQIIGKHASMVKYTNDQNVEYQGFYLGFNGIWRFCINEPFYRWHHCVTGQGWLLEPAPLKN